MACLKVCKQWYYSDGKHMKPHYFLHIYDVACSDSVQHCVTWQDLDSDLASKDAQH